MSQVSRGIGGINLDQLDAQAAKAASLGMPFPFQSPEEAVFAASQPHLVPVAPNSGHGGPAGGTQIASLMSPIQAITLPMYWPGDEELSGNEVRVNNVEYVFAAKAITRIGPKMEHVRNAKHQVIETKEGTPAALKVADGGDPMTICSELVQRNEDKGLVLLYGDGNDPYRIQEGRKRYVRWRRKECDKLVSRHKEACANAMAGGFPAPYNTPQIRRAQEFLNFHDEQLHDRKRYVVQLDGTDFDTFSAAETYLALNFPASVLDPKAILDTQPTLPKVIGDSSTLPQAQSYSTRGEQIARVDQVLRRGEPAPQATEVPSGDAKVANMREQAKHVLARAGEEGIILSESVREGLAKEVDPTLLEIHIADAMDVINGPNPAA